MTANPEHGGPEHGGAVAAESDERGTVEALLRQVGRGLVGINVKIDALAAGVRALEGAADGRARDRVEEDRAGRWPAGFDAVADLVDGLDRTLDRLDRFAAAERAAEQEGRSPGERVRRRGPFGWLWRRGRAPRPAEVGAAATSAARRRCLDELDRTREGLGLLREQALDRLARERVHPVPAAGAFDPEVHRAVGTDPAVEAGGSARTARRGYLALRGERRHVLRSALVVVGSASSTLDPAGRDSEGKEGGRHG